MSQSRRDWGGFRMRLVVWLVGAAVVTAIAPAGASEPEYRWIRSDQPLAARNSVVPELAALGNDVVAAWTEVPECGSYGEEPAAEVVVRRSFDGGSSFGPRENVSQSPVAGDWEPALAVSGRGPVIAWGRDEAGGCGGSPRELVVAHDHGAGWRQVTVPSLGMFVIHNRLAASGDRVFYVGGEQPAAVIRSVDGGATWGRAEEITPGGASQSPTADVAVDGRSVVILWRDWRDGRPQPEVYGRTSSDGGDTWSQDARLTDTGHREFAPVVQVRGSTIVSAWVKQVTQDTAELVATASTDAGQSWTGPKTVAALDGYYTNWAESSTRPILAKTPDGFQLFAHRHDLTVRLASTDGINWSEAPPPPSGGGAATSELARVVFGGSTLQALTWDNFHMRWALEAAAPDPEAPEEPASTALTTSVSRGRAHTNDGVTISGLLRPTPASAQVTVERNTGGRWVAVATTGTSSDGSYRVEVPVGNRSAIVRFRARFAGDPQFAATTSSEVSVKTYRAALVRVEANAPGRDRMNLNGEFIVLKNAGAHAIQLRDWRLKVARTTVKLPRFKVEPGVRIRIQTGRGRNIASQSIYLDLDREFLPNHGGHVRLVDPGTHLSDSLRY